MILRQTRAHVLRRVPAEGRSCIAKPHRKAPAAAVLSGGCRCALVNESCCAAFTAWRAGWGRSRRSGPRSQEVGPIQAEVRGAPHPRGCLLLPQAQAARPFLLPRASQP